MNVTETMLCSDVGGRPRGYSTGMYDDKATILCIADSSTRLDSIARTVKKIGYNVHIIQSPHHAVAVVANPTNRIDAIVIDEDMILNGFSIAQSFKAFSSIPILLVCDKGNDGDVIPAGVDRVTANSSREEIAAGLENLLHRSLAAGEQG